MFEAPEDSLIAYEWANLALIASFMLFMGVIAMVGFLSRKLEDAIFFTIVCSASVVLSFLLAIAL